MQSLFCGDHYWNPSSYNVKPCQPLYVYGVMPQVKKLMKLGDRVSAFEYTLKDLKVSYAQQMKEFKR